MNTLFFEDFDHPVPSKVLQETSLTREESPYKYTEEDMKHWRESIWNDYKIEEEARRIEDKKKWEEEIKDVVERRLENLSDRIDNSINVIGKKTALTIISQVCALLPNVMEHYGNKERDSLIERIIPNIRLGFPIHIQGNEDDVGVIIQRMKNITSSNITFSIDKAAKSGDFVLSWGEGRLSRSGEQLGKEIIALMEAQLNECGSERGADE
ncbi:hypothetical protein [Swingsia samuiensis]|uniref:Flagellar assembly protein FliH/Type III secretion system HrpE domain-containing protein n=1 Tax=Swingsia samuiensis TaxID=1293412 RepID=A0A4Y6ULZ9_9PROT|nr:hypothetical protein [Swingsia samuiensis]QDH17357.1 hypothetical protein E3D00_07125 [Swingsia samuiensis]